MSDSTKPVSDREHVLVPLLVNVLSDEGIDVLQELLNRALKCADLSLVIQVLDVEYEDEAAAFLDGTVDDLIDQVERAKVSQLLADIRREEEFREAAYQLKKLELEKEFEQAELDLIGLKRRSESESGSVGSSECRSTTQGSSHSYMHVTGYADTDEEGS